jgi:hypothetical protein
MGITVYARRMNRKMAFAPAAVALQSFVENLHQVDGTKGQVIGALHDFFVQGRFIQAMRAVNVTSSVTVELDDSYFLGHLNFLDDPTGKIV